MVKTLSVSDVARMACLGVDILWAAMATVLTESGIGILAFGQGDAQDYFSVLLKPGDFLGEVLKRIVEA
ncbi:hypothetical protein [Eubacterium aggregans]|uniref:hypothetical protein n=1 Tax=Eubacterium aggregans TaxID=81409 RepID=UPI003F2BCEEF